MKDDCKDEFHLRLQSQGCIFQKKSWGHGPLCTCRHMHKHIHAQRHRSISQSTCLSQPSACHQPSAINAWMYYKGNSLKSLSREVVTSAALFTRLMPRCTQERVNQARGYTRRPEPASSSSRSFPVPLGTGTRLRHAMAALTEMKAGRLLDTLVHYTQFEYE